MSRLLFRIAIGLYVVVGIALVAQGLRYLLTDEFMAYHEAVAGASWAHLDRGFQLLVLGLLKGFGAGALCVGVTVVWFAFGPLRGGSRWAVWATPVMAGGYSGLLVYVTGFALSPGATPILVSKLLLGLVGSAVALYALGWWATRANRTGPGASESDHD